MPRITRQCIHPPDRRLEGNDLRVLSATVFDGLNASAVVTLSPGNEQLHVDPCPVPATFTTVPSGSATYCAGILPLGCVANDDFVLTTCSGFTDGPTLDLSSRKLTAVLPSAFDDIAVTVTSLSLRDNAITELPSAVFDPLSSLTSL